MKKQSTEFENFDKVMGGLLAVPHAELQKQLEKEQREKAKHKKGKRPTSTASARASSTRKKRVV